MSLAVCSWNLFHGRSEPATHHDLFPAFVDGLATHPWKVCGLQEAPPWWAGRLGMELGATVRSTRTSLLRSLLPGPQARIHARDPETIGVRGAAANILLVRPSAGVVIEHRAATLRWFPQRRTVQAVRLRRAGGKHLWVANVHTHNKPESEAALDLIRALRVARAWAGPEPLVVLGDLNLPVPQGLARVEGFEHLSGQRVDHILGRGVMAAGGAYAVRVQPESGVTLSDHRIVGLTVTAP